MGLLDDVRVNIGDDSGAPSGSFASLHNLLSTLHPDTTPGSPVNAAIIVGNGTKWAVFPSGAEGTQLSISQGIIQWASGVPGPSGIQGPAGPSGAQGPTGPTGPQGLAASESSDVLTWGNNSVGASTTDRYLTPWYDQSTARTAPIQYPVPRSGVLQNMYVYQNDPAGNGNNIVYTLRVDGIPTALSATLASTATSGVDNINTVQVTEGRLLDIEVTKAASVASSPNRIMLIMEFT